MSWIKPTVYRDDPQPFRNRLWIAWIKGAMSGAVTVGGTVATVMSRFL